MIFHLNANFNLIFTPPCWKKIFTDCGVFIDSPCILCWERAGLKHRTKKHQKKSPRKKRWYDIDCKQMYCQLKSLARRIRHTPTNLSLVNQYGKLRKCYSRLLSSKKLAFRKCIFDKLDNLQSNKPQAF